MFVAVELHFRHYDPEELRAGMLFMNHLYPGNEGREHIEIFELTQESIHEQVTPELMFMENGFPVYPYLLDLEGAVVATPEEIGLFDPGDISDNLIDFGVKEMNFIMQEFDGLLEVFVDEDKYEEGITLPVLDDGQVIMKFLDDNEQVLNWQDIN
jgi:hypothetical protein